MRRAAIVTVLAVLTAGALPAIPPEAVVGRASPVGGPVPPEARALVEQLGSPDFRAREKAGKALQQLGDRALPALKAALAATEDAEVRRRVEVIVQKLEAERLASPRRVTLKVVAKPAREIVAEIARQTGYTLQFQGGGDEKAKLSFDWKDTPFWEALDQVCDATGLAAYQSNDESGFISLQFSDSFNPYVSYAGPFKLVANNINSGRNLQLGGLPRRQPVARQPEYLSLNLNLSAEPKAPVVGVGQAVLSKATDDTGASLLPPEPDPSQSVSYYPPPATYRSFQQGFGVNLARANQRATTIKELRGKVPVAVLAEVRPEVVVADVLKAKKKRVAGRTAELEVISADFANDVLALELTVRRRHGEPEDYNWMNLLPQRLEVLDAAGVKFTFNGVNNQQVGPNVATYQMQFMAPQLQGQPGKRAGKPATLQLVEWVTVTRDVPFSFKDIPLP